MPPALAEKAVSGLAYRYNESQSEIKDDFGALLSCLVSHLSAKLYSS